MKKVEDLIVLYSIIQHAVRFTLRHNREIIWQKGQVQAPKDVLVQVFGSVVMSGMQHMKRKDEEHEV